MAEVSFLLNDPFISTRLGRRENELAAQAVSGQRKSVPAPQATAEGIGLTGTIKVSEGNASTQRMIPKDFRRAAIPGRPVQGTLPDRAGGTPKGVADLTALPAGSVKIQISSGDPLQLPEQTDPIEDIPFSRGEVGGVCQVPNLTGGGAGGEDDSSEEDEDGGDPPGGSGGQAGDSPKGGPDDPCVPGNGDTGCQWYSSPQSFGRTAGTATFGSDPGTTYYLVCDDSGGGGGTFPPGAGCPSDTPKPNDGQSPPGTELTLNLFNTRINCNGVDFSGPLTPISGVIAPYNVVQERGNSPTPCSVVSDNPGAVRYQIVTTVTWNDRNGTPTQAIRGTQNDFFNEVTVSEA